MQKELKRLTKNNDTQYDFIGRYDTNIEEFSNNKELRISVMNKLGQLEDVEEELGIDLINTIELCKKVNAQKFVYTKENWGIDTLKFFDDLDIELFTGRLYVNNRGSYISLKIKEYSNTWALTREELENE